MSRKTLIDSCKSLVLGYIPGKQQMILTQNNENTTNELTNDVYWLAKQLYVHFNHSQVSSFVTPQALVSMYAKRSIIAEF